MKGAASVIDIMIIAKDMATAVLEGVKKTADKVASGIGGAFSKITDFTAEVAQNITKGAKIITAGFVTAGVGIFKLVKDAGSFQSVSDSYSTMIGAMGIDTKKLIKDIKKATANTVSEMDIMQNVMTATTLIGKEALGKDMGATFERMAIIAKKASRATGKDVDFMMQSLVTGIGRASPLILDNLGITVRATDVYDKYAKSIGKTGDELTITEQKTALLNAVLEQGEEKYKDVSVTAGGVSSALQRLAATTEDLRYKLGEKLSPILTPLINKVTEFMTAWEEPILKFVSEKVEEIQKWLGKMLDKLKEIDKEFGITDKFKEFGEWVMNNQDLVKDFIKNLFLIAGGITAVSIALGVLTSPLTVATILIGLLAAAVTVWENDIWGVKTKFYELTEQIKDTEAYQNLKTKFDELTESIKESTRKMVEQELQMSLTDEALLDTSTWIDFFTSKIDSLKTKFEEIMTNPMVALFLNTIKELARLIKENLMKAWEKLEEKFTELKPELEELRRNLEPILSVIGKIALAIAGSLIIAIGDLIYYLTWLLTPAIDGAAFAFEALLKWINWNFDQMNKLVETVKTLVKWLDKVPSMPNAEKDAFSEMRNRATGGIINEPMTIVGERGPELISAPHGSRVHTASETRKMMGQSSGGVNVVVNNYDTRIDENKLAGDIMFKTKLAFNRI